MVLDSTQAIGKAKTMQAKLSMAAAILHGGDPLSVGHYEPTERHELAEAVRELAADTGMPIPEGWTLDDETPPIGSDPFDTDYFEASDDIGLFPDNCDRSPADHYEGETVPDEGDQPTLWDRDG
jgi:hypothetical protein